MPTLLMLHGLTGDGNMMEKFAKNILPSNFTLITPNAPFKHEGRGYCWWKYPRGDLETLQAEIHHSIQYLLELIPKEGPIIIGGFSQGAALSLELLFSSINSRISGIIVLGSKSIDVSDLKLKLNKIQPAKMFWMHGKTDQIILFEEGEKVVNIFENTNWDVTRINHEKGHMIPKEFHNEIFEWLSLFSH
jgi:predicted esterase